MSWQEDHRTRVERFPVDVRAAHAHSSLHRTEVEASELCGCFYCGARYPPSKITEWVDGSAEGVGQTALCPECGIDSVIGDRSGFVLSDDFLATMKRYWF